MEMLNVRKVLKFFHTQQNTKSDLLDQKGVKNSKIFHGVLFYIFMLLVALHFREKLRKKVLRSLISIKNVLKMSSLKTIYSNYIT